MRKAVLILCLLPTVVLANPGPDQLGVYFDQEAITFCNDAVPVNVPFPVYVILTNPVSPEVHGVEFSLCPGGPGGPPINLFELARTLPAVCPPPIDLSIDDVDLCGDGLAFACPEPIPFTGSHVVVLTLQYLVLSHDPIDFFLGPHSAPSVEGWPAYIAEGDTIRSLGLPSGDPAVPVASIGWVCGDPPENTTFGRLKATYR